MNTALSSVSLQPELFQLTVMARHGCLLPATSGLTPYAQRTIRRAINLLDKYLRQPGIVFTSSTAARDWLRLQLARQERGGLWCSIMIINIVYWKAQSVIWGLKYMMH